MSFSLFLTSFLLISSSSCFSQQRPQIPEPGCDLVMTKGETMGVFFGKRRDNNSCRQELSARKLEFDNARDTLNALVQSGKPAATINEAEELKNEARKNYLALVKDCGDCAANPILSKTVHTSQGTENWQISDGSCWISDPSPAEKLHAYEVRKESLLKVAQYAGATGGFSNILSFIWVDPVTGQYLNHLGKIDSSPYYSFIAVRGPRVLGYLSTAAAFFFKGEFKERETNGVREFFLHYSEYKAPRGFRLPTVYETLASGDQYKTTYLVLSKIQGSWYLNSEGYMRYYTAADMRHYAASDFGLTLPYMTDLARHILLDTLVDMSERGNRP